MKPNAKEKKRASRVDNVMKVRNLNGWGECGGGGGWVFVCP